ncbi:Rieske (2Fe-2S) iron-sulfur domain protein [[Leptolyngbya] sp. PCC 7376]|uniref:Rieske 2Fe-2S domain-containing protein n=1 Tax=[Leptolyngbya] sp. PCC 7376 TaxID=111781 RepID=UPI00029EF502|nr:Rieske 2Fe-2S domain-containing protein [[Leptolyngbya] sp. PCC 7376]AFY38594.1 Rieske (2Fe-2S) iron-sulfur domain protein [[Leptolyngbya] sp. PCC 7376]
MSVAYKSIQWNRQVIIYDVILWASVIAYLFVFEAIAKSGGSSLDLKGIWIRDYGSAGFILLHIILAIGPLCRLFPKFLPLLYNRRHMGVTMFALGVLHAKETLGWYHDFGNLKPIVSLFVSNTNYTSFIRFPFESLGAIALVIFLFMAVTSHDFWLVNLTPPIWKALHMGVYVAYGLLVSHVILGALETNRHPLMTALVGVGFVTVVGLHLIAGLKEAKTDGSWPFGKAKHTLQADAEGYVAACTVDEIPENRAKIVVIAGERVAIFKYDGKISAISNVCQHQNGPLGEGKIIDGCVTCPWHAYQYYPDNGSSPPPFTEKVPTFNVKVEGTQIFVASIPNRPGTPVEPAHFTEEFDS